MALLEMVGITKSFPGVIANKNVSLEVHQGEILALLGENGAGKTTLMNILYGLYSADSGEIYLDGQKVAFSSPRHAIKAGIGMVHQHFMLVQRMTVLQNIILGLRPKGYPWIDYKQISGEIEQLARKYGLAVDVNKKITQLSVGEQQRVEILKSLYRNARILIFDEPTGVLTPQETDDFFAIIRRLKAEGHGIIIITHRMSEIMQISDRVTILRDGKNIVSLITAETNPHELSQHMIGRELNNQLSKNCRQEKSELLLSVEEVSLSDKGERKLDQINLEIQRGEIFAIAGVDGNGQNELAQVIVGIRKCDRGEIVFCGEKINHKTVFQRYQSGIAYVPDDRQQDGLVMDLDIAQNLLLRLYQQAPFAKHFVLNRAAIHKMAADAIREYRIKTPDVITQVRLLSGGNQQKVILARELAGQPELIVVCQPTRGLDIGATENLRLLLAQLRNRGKSVLLISADLEEVLSLADRIGVMFRGKIVGVLDNHQAVDLQELGALMGGHIESAADKEKRGGKMAAANPEVSKQ